MHCLAENTSKYTKCGFANFIRQTEKDPREEEKNILNILCLFQRQVLITKSKRFIEQRKSCENDLHLILGALVGWQITLQNLLSINLPNMFIWLEETLGKEQKITLRLLFVTRRRVLIKKQRVLYNRQNLRMWFIFDSGYNDWQSKAENLLNVNLLILVGWPQESLLNINLPNLVGWLEETLEKNQKLYWTYSL